MAETRAEKDTVIKVAKQRLSVLQIAKKRGNTPAAFVRRHIFRLSSSSTFVEANFR